MKTRATCMAPGSPPSFRAHSKAAFYEEGGSQNSGTSAILRNHFVRPSISASVHGFRSGSTERRGGDNFIFVARREVIRSEGQLFLLIADRSRNERSGIRDQGLVERLRRIRRRPFVGRSVDHTLSKGATPRPMRAGSGAEIYLYLR